MCCNWNAIPSAMFCSKANFSIAAIRFSRLVGVFGVSYSGALLLNFKKSDTLQNSVESQSSAGSIRLWQLKRSPANTSPGSSADAARRRVICRQLGSCYVGIFVFGLKGAEKRSGLLQKIHLAK